MKKVIKHRAKPATATQIRRSLHISKANQRAALATLKKMGLVKVRTAKRGDARSASNPR